MKSEDFNGIVRLWNVMEDSNNNKINIYKPLNPTTIKGTTDWARYDISFDVLTHTKEITVGIRLVGTGTVWFDDFTMTTSPILPKAHSAKIKNLLEKNIIPLSEMTLNNEREKNFISHLCGDAKVIGLGEVTHGTSEAYTFRANISKYLIEEKGFNTICLENSYGWTERLNEYIQTENGNLDSLMKDNLLSIWRNQEMKSFLEWLQMYNRSNSNKVQIKGIDYSALHPNIDIIKKALLNVSDEEFTRWTDSLSCLLGYLDKEYHNGNKKGYKRNNKIFIKSYLKSYDLALKMEDRLDIIKTQLDEKRFSELKSALYNTRLGCYNFYKFYRIDKKQPGRDTIMAAMVHLFLKENPNNKIVIFAHNAHISKEVLYKGSNGGGMGYHLNKFFLGSYKAIGMGTASGTYSYTEDRFITEKSYLLKTIFNPPISGSIEHIFSEGKVPDFFLDLSNTETNSLPELYFRLIGYKKENGNENYLKVELSKLFDGFIFLKKTHASQSF
ncbi:MAG TPA: erythromycin esterase family protein [Niabella sp.]|nr:erythromycin esterase family protein [Niabella sp.]